MAFVVKDRVKQSTTTTGTGSIVLNGTVSGFQTFTNALSDGDTTYYAIFEVSTNEWEVGVGTWTESTTTLARTTVLASSNSNSAIDLSAQAEVFITQPAGKAAFFDPSGDLTLVQDPTSNLQAATKQYVDTIAAAGLHYHDPVRVEQEGNLSATYSNGTAGVGATLTNNSTQAALTIDGVALSLNDRVLIYEQTNGYENGIYTVTNVGSASTNWVLTRATDADSYAPSDPDSLGQGDAFFVLEGAAGAGELYVMNTSGTITFGTTNITFTQVASTAVYSAGTGLTLTGTEFAADGANITNVDAVTLDGIDSSQFLRSDVVDTKTAGNLIFNDNVEARFGTSSDLRIYHNSTNSVIWDEGVGNLQLVSSGSGVDIIKAGGENMATFATDGAVTLYYDNASKLATTSTGISVTGTVNVPFKQVGTYTVSGINGGAVDTNGGDIVTGRIFFTGSSDSGTELFGFNNESTGLTLYNYVDGHYALYIANSNNIGLGTNTPGGKLEVNSNSSFPIIRARYNSSYYTDYNSNGITYNGSGQTFNFIDNGSTKVTIASGGNVGIGITSPTAALHVAKSSGNTIINLQRTNTNTTGSVGTIQFSALDDHAVASIAAFGDGDDEGAYLSFRTTSAATTNSWYTGTDEAMRIDSNRDIRFYNSSGNVNLFWDASTMALGIGTGTTTPTNPITIQQTSVHWPYIALTNSSGVTKSQFGYQVNDDLLDIVANSGGIKFRTNNTETMRLTSTGNLGIGETAPHSGLHVKGSGSSSWITIENTLAGNYSIVDFLNNSGNRVAYVGTYNNDNALYLYGAQNGPMQFFTNSTERMRLTSAGNLGIGTQSPNTALEVKRTSGTANLRLHADHEATPRTAIEFMRGTTDTFGGDAYTDWKIGHVGSDQADFAIISHDTTRGANERLTIEYNTGNVGIGTTSPQYPLHISGGSSTRADLLLSYDAIGNGATDGMQVGIQATNGGYNWVFENMDWYVGTNNTRKLTVKNNGYVGIGISSPSQELHVHTTSSGNADVRLTGYNQTSTYMDVYSGTTSSGLWVVGSSDMRLGTNGTERLTIDTSGNVGIGTSSPSAPLTISTSGNQGVNDSVIDIVSSLTTSGATRFLSISEGTTTAAHIAYSHSNNNLEFLSQQSNGGISFFTGGINNRLEITEAGTVSISGANAPETHAYLNIGSAGSAETRAIDIDGSWSANESKSISFTHGSSSGNLVGQWNVQHNGPGSRMRWGKLYHSTDSSTYTMELVSTSTTTADLSVVGNINVDGNVRRNGSTTETFTIAQNTTTTDPAMTLWGRDHGTYPGQVHIVGRNSNANTSSGDIQMWNYNGSTWFNMFKFSYDTDNSDTRATIETGTDVNTAIMSKQSMYFIIDSENDQNDRGFFFGHNADRPGAATQLMTIKESGSVTVGTTNVFSIGGSAKLTLSGASGTVYLAGGSASGDQFYLRKNASVTGMYEWQTYYSSNNAGTIQLQPYGGSITIGGSNATTTHKLQVFGSFAATTKSFVIDHPTKEGMKLRHGSLEGPEDGVYVRGRLTGKTVIELPDYWTGLVHEDSITVQLTAMGGKADLWVESIADNKVTVGCDTEVDCFYFVQATRKDVDAWEVEYVADS